MSRDTQIGLALAVAFLVLVGGVLYYRMEHPDDLEQYLNGKPGSGTDVAKDDKNKNSNPAIPMTPGSSSIPGQANIPEPTNNLAGSNNGATNNIEQASLTNQNSGQNHPQGSAIPGSAIPGSAIPGSGNGNSTVTFENPTNDTNKGLLVKPEESKLPGSQPDEEKNKLASNNGNNDTLNNRPSAGLPPPVSNIPSANMPNSAVTATSDKEKSTKETPINIDLLGNNSSVPSSSLPAAALPASSLPSSSLPSPSLPSSSLPSSSLPEASSSIPGVPAASLPGMGGDSKNGSSIVKDSKPTVTEGSSTIPSASLPPSANLPLSSNLPAANLPTGNNGNSVVPAGSDVPKTGTLHGTESPLPGLNGTLPPANSNLNNNSTLPGLNDNSRNNTTITESSAPIRGSVPVPGSGLSGTDVRRETIHGSSNNRGSATNHLNNGSGFGADNANVRSSEAVNGRPVDNGSRDPYSNTYLPPARLGKPLPESNFSNGINMNNAGRRPGDDNGFRVASGNSSTERNNATLTSSGNVIKESYDTATKTFYNFDDYKQFLLNEYPNMDWQMADAALKYFNKRLFLQDVQMRSSFRAPSEAVLAKFINNRPVGQDRPSSVVNNRNSSTAGSNVVTQTGMTTNQPVNNNATASRLYTVKNNEQLINIAIKLNGGRGENYREIMRICDDLVSLNQDLFRGQQVPEVQNGMQLRLPAGAIVRE